jgi:hypothetical protein
MCGGWCPSELLPWIQSQDPKEIVGLGIAMFLIAGKLARNLTLFFFDFPNFSLLLSGNDVLLVLGNIKEKVMSLKLAFSSTADDVQDTGASYLGGYTCSVDVQTESSTWVIMD